MVARLPKVVESMTGHKLTSYWKTEWLTIETVLTAQASNWKRTCFRKSQFEATWMLRNLQLQFYRSQLLSFHSTVLKTVSFSNLHYVQCSTDLIFFFKYFPFSLQLLPHLTFNDFLLVNSLFNTLKMGWVLLLPHVINIFKKICELILMIIWFW